MKNIKLSVSILDSDFTKIKNTVKMLKKNKVDFIHFDVMDGNFVPNLTFGPKFIAQVRKLTSLPFDVHLMIKHPEKYINDFINAGSDFLTIHYEATENVSYAIDKIKKKGIKAGLSIKPKTKVNKIIKYLNRLDLILIMSVEPGFGGQKFIHEVLEKVKYLKKIKEKFNFLISIDGGINIETAPLAYSAGVDVIVSGSAIFKAKKPELMIKKIFNSVK